MKMFQLTFPINEINDLANEYDTAIDENDQVGEQYIRTEIVPQVIQRGFYTKDEFVLIGRWKSPRPTPHYKANESQYIEEVTRVALGTSSEQLRIEVLTLLKGVSWPVASVLLHFAFPNTYPILDFRAFWSLGIEVSDHTYDFPLWSNYVKYCRKLATEADVTMRTLDKALWQYSKLHQV